VVRGFLLRPLEVIDGRLTALVTGERTTMVEESDKFCAEVQRLAESCERLRVQGARGERKR